MKMKNINLIHSAASFLVAKRTINKFTAAVSLCISSFALSPCAIANGVALPNAIEVSNLVEEFTPAKPLTRVPPNFPTSAARQGHEGWVQLSFIIDEDGQVLEPRVIDSRGPNSFKREAIKSISKWQYQPAISNGEPIKSCQNSVQLTFSLSADEAHVSRRFGRFYRDMTNLMNSGKLEELKQALDESRYAKGSNLTEMKYLDVLYADYHGKKQNWAQQIKYLQNITYNPLQAHKSDDSKTALFNLQSLFIAQVRMSKYFDAIKTFEGIKLFTGDERDNIIDAFTPYYQQILALKNSDQPITYQATLTEDGDWKHKLFKNQFSLLNVNGAINKLQVRCQKQHSVYVPKENNKWTIPDSWGRCNVFVDGEPGSTFILVETKA